MSITDSYIDGFCKTAEQYGIDPEQLIKSAFSIGSLGSGLSKAWQFAKGSGGRAMELATGRGRALDGYNELQQLGGKDVIGALRKGNFRDAFGNLKAKGSLMLGTMRGKYGKPEQAELIKSKLMQAGVLGGTAATAAATAARLGRSGEAAGAQPNQSQQPVSNTAGVGRSALQG